MVHKGEELSEFERWLADQPEQEELESFHHSGIGVDLQRPTAHPSGPLTIVGGDDPE